MLPHPSTLIVIPAFNRPGRLAGAVKSVLNQTHPDFSLVVVDDASGTDLSHCRTVVCEANHHWKVMPTNQGPAAARNFGAEAGAWEWVMFLDSDDRWFPEKLEKHLAWNLTNPEIRISQVSEKWIRNHTDFQKPKHLEQPGGDIFADCVSRCAISPSCVAIRRDLWEESGGFNPWFRVCEDYELWLRIASREKIGLVHGDPLVEKHGGHPDQLSTSVPALDGYRLVALAMLLNQAIHLSEIQREIVIRELNQKAAILAKGAARRGRNEWERFFRDLEVPLPEESISRVKAYCTSESSPGN